ncbi:hypothetical protein RS030_193004 [Cryptosporidium xiaoi]|uniref:Uncharacterized protein n=1 Tax=Cryptosporidium xiaoi TaxID=659607 RepID=A0AAV9XZM1_9CRYT
MVVEADLETKSSIILQRAYRRWKLRWNETLNILVLGIMYTRERAAVILQRWWRYAIKRRNANQCKRLN